VWRGGGVSFGPQPRVRDLKVSQKTKQGVMGSLAYAYLSGNKVLCLDWNSEITEPKTRIAYDSLKRAGLDKQKVALFVSPQDALAYTSFANIPDVKIVFFDQPNAFDVTHAQNWVVFNKDLETFKQMVGKWI
jgi:large subunit ribosomal protein L4